MNHKIVKRWAVALAILLLSPVLALSQTADVQYQQAQQAVQTIVQPSLDALAAYRAAVEAQIASLQGQLASTQTQLTLCQTSGSSDTQTITDLQAQIASLQTQLSAAQASLAAAQSETLALQGQVASDQTTITSLQSQLSQVPPNSFADLQMHGDWAQHTGDPSIGPWALGASASIVQFQKFNGAQYAMKLSIQGISGSWSDALWSLSRRPIPPAGRVVFSGRIWTDANTPSGAQALEIDTIISKGGFRYNLSSQINYNKNGMLQISAPTGGWVDTTIMVGKLVPSTWHTFKWEYVWNDSLKTYSYVAFTLDGKVYPAPASGQNLAPIATNWTDSVHPQLQLDTNSAAIGYSVWYDNLDYTFPN